MTGQGTSFHTKFTFRSKWTSGKTRRIRRNCALCLLLLPSLAWGQQKPDAALEHVLDQLDNAAANFRSAQADFVWDQYQKVVDETDTQKGTVYYRRTAKDTEMAADITDPDKKYVLMTEGKIQVYQPRIDQVAVYNSGKNRETVESFMVLGFGGGGHDMLKSFDVSYLGKETLNGVETEKLDLVPKAQNIRNSISHIVLWIDPARGVSVQQGVFQPSGDYRLAKYSDIRINQKIAESVFKLKTTGKTKFIAPQGQ